MNEVRVSYQILLAAHEAHLYDLKQIDIFPTQITTQNK